MPLLFSILLFFYLSICKAIASISCINFSREKWQNVLTLIFIGTLKQNDKTVRELMHAFWIIENVTIVQTIDFTITDSTLIIQHPHGLNTFYAMHSEWVQGSTLSQSYCESYITIVLYHMYPASPQPDFVLIKYFK